MQKFGELSLDPEVHEHRARARSLVLPPCVREGLQIVGQQLCFGEMKVSARHHDVRLDRVLGALRITISHACCLGAIVFVDGDRCDRRVRVNDDAGFDCEVTNCVNDPSEPALRIQHAVDEVEVAHEVEHRRRVERTRSKEDRGVAQNLLGSRGLHVSTDERPNRASQQANERAESAEDLTIEERQQALER